MTASPAQTGERLPALCSDLFAFALSLRTSQAPEDCDRLQATIAGLLEKLGQRCRDAGVDSAHLDAARYALIALLDEIVLGSRWELKTQWMSKPLQMSYYGDFTAGEQFYQRLDALLQDTEANVDAIEVYAQCLAAGFRGKHADLAGMQKIDDLLAELTGKIRLARGVEGRALSRPLVRTEVLSEETRRLPVWVVAAAGAGLALLLWFVLDSLLASQADEFLRAGGTGR
ncbi:MAG: type IVB secretion system protein IcmH/DotU [Planctomycetes bacterium]|nr:type IVB secretion system protein IcmH/DotU [Planctomycetota bacterium]